VGATLFPASPADDGAALAAMARHDVALLTGLALPAHLTPRCERPVITDSRMTPHEWLRTSRGEILKVDACTHGDDHFYPGPTDIAWDLAGAVIEFGLEAGERGALLAAYRSAAGEDPRSRLPAHEIAYAAFRACHAGMAAFASPDPDEARRLRAAAARYRRALERRLAGVPGLTPATAEAA
jgi:hypothetical protein